MTPENVQIKIGFSEAQRQTIASLFWQAFSGKLGRLMAPDEKALRFIASVLQPSHAILAQDADGTVFGAAGFKTKRGGLVGGSYRDMAAVYGWIGGFWRGIVLELLERPIKEGELLMDGIFVAEAARGKGVGTALIEAISEHAVAIGCHDIRLDVIDSNPRAKALYERMGFTEVETVSIGVLRHIFGFRSSTTMRKRV